MDFEKNDVAVGAFVLGSMLVFLLALAAINRERIASETYHLQIQLPEIAGIDKGVEVVYRGYKAGSVDQVTVVYEPEFRFIVSLAIKSEVRLRKGTYAVARSKGWAGARYIELTSPEKGEGPFLKDGAFLQTVRETDLMVRANEVMGEARETLQRFQKQRTAEEIVNAVKQIQASFASLERTLNGISLLMEENRSALKATLEQTQGIATRSNDILARQGAAIERTSRNIDQATLHLPAIMVNIEELTAEIKRNPWRILRKGDAPGGAVKLDHSHPETAAPAPAKP